MQFAWCFIQQQQQRKKKWNDSKNRFGVLNLGPKPSTSIHFRSVPRLSRRKAQKTKVLLSYAKYAIRNSRCSRFRLPLQMWWISKNTAVRWNISFYTDFAIYLHFGWFLIGVHTSYQRILGPDPSQQLPKEPREEKHKQMMAYELSIFVEGCILLNHLIPFGFLFHIWLCIHFVFFSSFCYVFGSPAKKTFFYVVSLWLHCWSKKITFFFTVAM